MAYTDAQGRPEIVMHPDIVRGAAAYRTSTTPDQHAPGDDRPATGPVPDGPRTGAPGR